MEEQILPIVPGGGKYAGKSVLELMADKSYVDGYLKNQSWFNPNNKNWAPIYNIIVNQSISTNKDGKTPQHNKLQNLFLNTSNQYKLISKLLNIDIDLNNLILDEEIIRCFGINIIPDFVNNLDGTKVYFEDKFNWDLILYYSDKQSFKIISKLETEISDKEEYKKKYDIQKKEEYENKLLLIDKLIEYRNKLDQKGINEYDEKMKEYLDKYKKYENDLKIYLQDKPQNEKDILNYENNLKMYDTKRDNFITAKKKLICQELGINYNNFVNWNITNNGYSHLDKDTKHTTQEKKQLRDIVNDKLNPFIKEFERLNTRPNFVAKLNIPTKPNLPQQYDFSKEIYILKDSEIYQLFEEAKKIKHMHNLYSVDKLITYKKEYENEYKKNYETEFNKHYEEYRLQYYKDIIKKYCIKNINVNKINENQYAMKISICDYYYEICCELKPVLSDDYPCVLRKLTTQMKLTHEDNTKNTKPGYRKRTNLYTLIIGNFTSVDTSKEQLITIFNQYNINVLFTNELFDTTELIIQDNKINNLNEKNIILENNLLEAQQKLLQEQEKNKLLEEKIKQLEEELTLLKSQKQSKTIKDYFGKK